MNQKIIFTIIIFGLITVIPTVYGQLTLGSEAKQELIELKINPDGEINVKHIVSSSNMPATVPLFLGEISNLIVTNDLGEEINSDKWDAYYSIDASGKYAYMASSNNSKGKEDIVRIKLKEEVQPDPVVLISGKVLNKKTNEPVDASIVYKVEASQFVQLFQSGSQKFLEGAPNTLTIVRSGSANNDLKIEVKVNA